MKTCRRGHERDDDVKRCRVCAREGKRALYGADPERARERQREFRRANLEHMRAYDRKRYEETRREHQRRYREKNRELIRKRARERYDREQARVWAARRKYGLSSDRWAMLAFGPCAICANLPADGAINSIDHDHACCPGAKSCGACVRGGLCKRCNSLLGHALDNIDILARAIVYLASSTVDR